MTERSLRLVSIAQIAHVGTKLGRRSPTSRTPGSLWADNRDAEVSAHSKNHHPSAAGSSRIRPWCRLLNCGNVASPDADSELSAYEPNPLLDSSTAVPRTGVLHWPAKTGRPMGLWGCCWSDCPAGWAWNSGCWRDAGKVGRRCEESVTWPQVRSRSASGPVAVRRWPP